MAATLLQSNTASNTTSSTTMTFTTGGSAIPVGSVLVLSTVKGLAASTTTGIASITNTWGTWAKRANSVRSLTQDLEIWTMEVTTQIPASSTFTITFNIDNNRKTCVWSAWGGLSSAVPNASSNNSAQGDSGTSVGPNGNNGSPSASTTAATTVNDVLLIGATGFSTNTSTVAPTNSFTEIGEIVTNVGTTDRGVQQQYRVDSTTGTKTSTETITGGTAWAAAIIALPIAASNAAPTADAGADQTNVEPYTTVTINGNASTDSDGTITSYAWAQIGGSPTVTLAGSGSSRTFEAPGTLAGTTLTFELTVTDDDSATDTDTMTVSILPSTERAVIGGVEVPIKVMAVSS